MASLALRSIVGRRGDMYAFDLKANITSPETELYLSGGFSLHSSDARAPRSLKPRDRRGGRTGRRAGAVARLAGLGTLTEE